MIAVDILLDIDMMGVYIPVKIRCVLMIYRVAVSICWVRISNRVTY